MAQYDSADLLSRLRVDLQRPGVDEDATDTILYQYLEEAQTYWASVIASHYPEALYGAAETMTTADSGKTYSVTGNVLGKMEVRLGANGPLLLPGPDWADSTGYVQEGSKIRMPRGIARTATFSARYAVIPGILNAATPPSLTPSFVRLLLVPRAAALFCLRGGHRDPTPYVAKEQRLWEGDPALPGDTGFRGMLARMYDNSGAGATDRAGNPWVAAPDFGVARANG